MKTLFSLNLCQVEVEYKVELHFDDDDDVEVILKISFTYLEV